MKVLHFGSFTTTKSTWLDAIKKTLNIKKPPPGCSGFKDFYGDYDCEAAHSESCEDCLVNYHTTGGLSDPDTGKTLTPWQAFAYHGLKKGKRLYIYKRRMK